MLTELANLLARLWLRLFSATTLPSSFLAKACDYLLSTGKYESMATFTADLHPGSSDSDPEVCAYFLLGDNVLNIAQSRMADPMDTWMIFRIPDGPRLYMEQLAEQIFSVCPNAMLVERFFSLLKHILALSRSRLTDTNLMNTAELKMFIMNEYESKGTLPEHLHRCECHFIDSSRPAHPTAPETNPPTSSAYTAPAPPPDGAHSAS